MAAELIDRGAAQQKLEQFVEAAGERVDWPCMPRSSTLDWFIDPLARLSVRNGARPDGKPRQQKHAPQSEFSPAVFRAQRPGFVRRRASIHSPVVRRESNNIVHGGSSGGNGGPTGRRCCCCRWNRTGTGPLPISAGVNNAGVMP